MIVPVTARPRAPRHYGARPRLTLLWLCWKLGPWSLVRVCGRERGSPAGEQRAGANGVIRSILLML